MGLNRKANFLVILIFLGVIVAFAYSYNASITNAITNTANNDQEILQDYNNEIIDKLVNEKSIDSWDEIIKSYEDIVVSVEDSNNNVVVKSDNKASTLDVNVQTPFEYDGRAYMIKSSVHLLRDYTTDAKTLARFIIIEFLIGISSVCLIIFTIYTIMLRPYRGLYRAIEEYDKTGKLRKVTFRGYIGEVYKRFVSMTENLDQQQKNQQRIIASISHDIKTPLTSILGYAERLKKDSIPPERKERYLDTVYGKALEIQDLVDEFDEYLSYNMAQSVKTEIVSAIELEQLLNDEYSDELENAGVKFEVINMAQKAYVMIDIPKIKRVFGNVISNSMKHFGGNEKIISILLMSDKDTLYINISDSGDGVDEENLEMIFQPLFTSDEGRKVAGLGLAICREIIDGHSGNICAKESDFGGLSVCIELPRVDKR